MLIVHTADIHLDAPLQGRRVYGEEAHNEVRLATRRAFTNLIELCLIEGADFLFIAGDMFDGETVDFNTGLFAHRQLAKLREAGTLVLIVKGNHDADHVVTKTLDAATSPHVTVMKHRSPDRLIFESHGVAVTGQSYANRHVAENLAVGFPTPVSGLFNVGLLHCDIIRGSAPTHYHYAPCSLHDLLASGYDYWALGHVHTRTVPNELNPLILYPGSTQGRDIRETGPRGCSLVRIENGSVIGSPAQRPLDAVRWEHMRVDVADCAGRLDILDRVRIEAAMLRRQVDADRHRGHPVVARVTVTGATAAHETLVCRREQFTLEAVACAEEEGIWVERVVLDTRRANDREPEDISGFLTALREAFAHLRTSDAEMDRYLRDLVPLSSFTGKYLQNASDVGHVRSLLNDAESLLIARLLGSDEQTADAER